MATEDELEKETHSQTSAQHELKVIFDSPFDFSQLKKWTITISAALTTFTCTFASSIFSSAVTVTAVEFKTSETVTMLGVSLYVLGFGCGPILWGPLSEYCGRRWPLLIGYMLFAIMQIPIALTPTLAGLLICRFLAGCFGSAPMTIVGALYTDFWDPAERGIAMSIYSIAAFAGPTCGPIAGSFITKSHLGWRWTAWITLIVASVVLFFAYLLVPETYAPVLKERAAKASGIDSSTTLKRVSSREASRSFVRRFLLKPASMLLHEPVLDITTLYISIAYGLIYFSFYAIPYSFDAERGWDSRIGSLAFVAMLVGVLAGNFFVMWYTKHYYQPRMKARGSFSPEDRIPLIIVGAFLLPVGLFWFAWTSSKSISWVPQMISVAFIGAGIMLVFSSCTALVIDTYLNNAASALAATTSVRSLVAAALPLAGPRMYSEMGTAWATSTLAFICVAMIPAPFLFYKYGPSMRSRSRYAYKQPSR